MVQFLTVTLGIPITKGGGGGGGLPANRGIDLTVSAAP